MKKISAENPQPKDKKEGWFQSKQEGSKNENVHVKRTLPVGRRVSSSLARRRAKEEELIQWKERKKAKRKGNVAFLPERRKENHARLFEQPERVWQKALPIFGLGDHHRLRCFFLALRMLVEREGEQTTARRWTRILTIRLGLSWLVLNEEERTRTDEERKSWATRNILLAKYFCDFTFSRYIFHTTHQLIQFNLTSHNTWL